jgi:putative hemolysin
VADSTLRLIAMTMLAFVAMVSASVAAPSKAAPSLVVGEFDGVLPCADCSGLDTRLKLVEDKAGAGKGTYVLSEDYIGKSPKPFKSSGHWATIKGTPKDPAATVYVLDPDKPKKTRYYLLRADGSLLSLDGERNEIDAPFDLSLKPRAVGLANPAATNCARQGGRSEIRKDASGGQYGVCLFVDGRVCEEWALFRDKSCVAPK